MHSDSRNAARALARPAAALAALLATAYAAPASAQVLERFALRGEGGAGLMLPDHQRTRLGYELAIQGSARLGISLVDAVAIQLSFSNWLFPSSSGNGGALMFGGGLRVEPRIGSVGRLWLDGNVGLGVTGGFGNDGFQRPMFDAGVGFEFYPTRWLGVGPAFRYAHMLAGENDVRSDAQFFSAGLTFALRGPPAEAPPVVEPPPAPVPVAPPDTDRDGVIDPEDQCVNEPQGDHPDPARRGCPARDSDNDTVYDAEDQCPTTPRGDHPDPERAGCPDGDDDNDTVLNHQDQCRTQHHGPFPDPNRYGCPLPDRDHDSVPDAADHCPDQPGAPHRDPNRNGCPGLVQIDNGQLRIMRPVFFATNRDRILPRSFPVLQAVADALVVTPAIRRVSVEGHTDDVGDDAQNLELSQRRANSVMAWLVQHGIAADRLESHGFGEARPLVPVAPTMRRRQANAARAQNRRVEFRILDPAMAAPAAAAAP